MNFDPTITLILAIVFDIIFLAACHLTFANYHLDRRLRLIEACLVITKAATEIKADLDRGIDISLAQRRCDTLIKGLGSLPSIRRSSFEFLLPRGARFDSVVPYIDKTLNYVLICTRRKES